MRAAGDQVVALSRRGTVPDGCGETVAVDLGDGQALGGGVYNVSSGRSVSAAEQVALLAGLIAPIEVEHLVDPMQVRAHEVSDLRGDHSRLTAATGWRPAIPFEQTMAWWESELAAG